MDYRDRKRLMVFLDESGDHSMDQQADPSYPVFGLAGILIEPEAIPTIAVRGSELKIKYFGHEGINLHSREIRRRLGPFSFLHDDVIRKDFFEDISAFISNAEFKITASVIHKKKLATQYTSPGNPYNLSLIFLMEKIFRYACIQGFDYIHYIVESRGKTENDNLHAVFKRFCEKGSKYIDCEKLKLIHQRIEFARKEQNIIGLQVADLTVTPVTKSVLSGVEHPSLICFKDKFLNGFSNGLKIFP